jgi:hypothetical protein
MNFPKHLIKHFKYYIDKKIFKRIPWYLKGKEVLVRCVISPFQYSESKNKIKSILFLPPPKSREISLLRHNFTNDNFCKKYAKQINIEGNEYSGLATLLYKHCDIINKINDINIKAKIEATPYNEEDERYYGKHIPVNMKGKPMHADLLYDEDMPQKGVPFTKHRKYAYQITKCLNFYKDNDKENEIWTGEKIRWNERSCVENVIRS